MILLQSQDKFDEVAELDPASGKLRWLSKEQARSPHIQGHVSRLGNKVACLYRSDDGTLHFRIDNQVFPLNPGTFVSHTKGRPNTLSVIRGGTVLYKWVYTSPDIDPPLEFDPTPMVEEEDFDFGLFVSNVSRDPERREGIYRR